MWRAAGAFMTGNGPPAILLPRLHPKAPMKLLLFPIAFLALTALQSSAAQKQNPPTRKQLKEWTSEYLELGSRAMDGDRSRQLEILKLLGTADALTVNGEKSWRKKLGKAWTKLKRDPALKFIVLSLAFYGLATFEGPMMAIRSVNVVSHFTDWTIGHVHSGALGWNAMVTYGTFYFLVPRLVGAELHSTRLANLHFVLALAGAHEAGLHLHGH
ncbi:MAG: cbb3-type cytochrome c oxidase subunit I, partial [Planctomycetes bacterium]|nr:cbb3-type cytochrome c oxidase subunit I [Planctomycetota bacterium]